MIDQITKNNQDIELYYHMGSIHGDIRMMLTKYVYDYSVLENIIRKYSELYGVVTNININTESNNISFEINNSSNTFQTDFANAMYTVIKNDLGKLEDSVDMFEKDNPKYELIKNKLESLYDSAYYITLFRAAFIKHENTTSCIIQL